MEQKTLDQNRLEKVLLALATLYGLDRAIRLLDNQRAVVAGALNGSREAFQGMTIGDLADGLRVLPTLAATPTKTRRRPALRRPSMLAKGARRQQHTRGKVKPAKQQTKAPTTFNGTMQTALKTLFADGPKKIRHIANSLKRQGVIKDTSPETKKAIVSYITHDKTTFSTKTRGVFGLRTRSA